MIEWLYLILALLLAPLLLGLGGLRFLGIGWSSDPLASLGWSWMAGSFGLGLLILGWLSVGTTEVPHWLPLTLVLALAALLYGLGRRRGPALNPAPLEHGHAWAACPAWEQAFCWAVLLLVTLASLEHILAGSILAVVGDDIGQFWSLRGKMLYSFGSLGAEYADYAKHGGVVHADYPLLNSLLHFWTFFSAERITHALNRVSMQVGSLALLIMLAASLRRVVRPALVAWLLLLFAGMSLTKGFGIAGLCELLVAGGVLMALDGFLRYRDSEDGRWLVLVSIGLALAAFTKKEGTAILIAVVVAWLVVHGRPTLSKFKLAAATLALPLCLILLQSALNDLVGIPTDNDMSAQEGGLAFLQHAAGRIGEVLSHTWSHVLWNPSHSNWVVMALASVALLIPRTQGPAVLRAPLLAFLFCFLGFALVFALVDAPLTWQLNTAAGRVNFLVVPSALLALGLYLGRVPWKTLGPPRRLLLSVVILALGWRSMVSAQVLSRRLWQHSAGSLERAFSVSENRRLRVSFKAFDKRQGLPTNTNFELFDAIRSNVPPDQKLNVFLTVGNPMRGLLARVRPASFPIQFSVAAPPPLPLTTPPPADSYLLDIEGQQDYWATHFQALETGPGWTLFGPKAKP